MQESIAFCSACTMLSYRKFTFAISSPDEFLVKMCNYPSSNAQFRPNFEILDPPVKIRDGSLIKFPHEIFPVFRHFRSLLHSEP